MANYELWLTNDEGERLQLLDRVGAFEYAWVYGDIGWASFSLPYDSMAVFNEAIPDRRVHIWRAARGEAQRLEAIVFLRRWQWATDTDGLTRLSVGGGDANELLARRITAYYTGSAETTMTDEADDMMKQVVTDNFIDGTDYSGAATGRDISGEGFSVQAKSADGPSITKSFSWTNVLTVLQGIQAASKSEGTEVFFAVRPATETSLVFETYTGQPGTDRTVASGSNPLVFGVAWGNVQEAAYGRDWIDEENFIYAGGRGEGTARNVQTASDAARIGQSVWNRREGFAQASNATTDNGVTAAARDRLAQKRPLEDFVPVLLDTPDTPYGGASGWRVGDKVTVSHLGAQRDVLIRSARIQIDEEGNESIMARVESV